MSKNKIVLILGALVVIAYIVFDVISTAREEERELAKQEATLKAIASPSSQQEVGVVGNDEAQSRADASSNAGDKNYPEFVLAPSYKREIAIHNMLENSLNPKMTEKWATLHLRSIAAREMNEISKNELQKAKNQYEAAMFTSKTEALRNGEFFFDDDKEEGSTESGHDASEAFVEPEIVVSSYRKGFDGRLSQVTLLVDGKKYERVVKDYSVGTLVVMKLSDSTRCVDFLWNPRRRPGSNSTQITRCL